MQSDCDDECDDACDDDTATTTTVPMNTTTIVASRRESDRIWSASLAPEKGSWKHSAAEQKKNPSSHPLGRPPDRPFDSRFNQPKRCARCPVSHSRLQVPVLLLASYPSSCSRRRSTVPSLI